MATFNRLYDIELGACLCNLLILIIDVTSKIINPHSASDWRNKSVKRFTQRMFAEQLKITK